MPWASVPAATKLSKRLSSSRACAGQGDRNTILMVGGEIGLISASENGTVLMWPESDLRQAAEGAGFDIPTRKAARKESTRLRDESRAANRVANATMVRAWAQLGCSGWCSGMYALDCGAAVRCPRALPCACLVKKLPCPACWWETCLHRGLMAVA